MSDQTGTIKRLYLDKKFGFIVGEDGRDYFFHVTDVKKPHALAQFEAGQAVCFDGQDSSKGPRATRVRPR